MSQFLPQLIYMVSGEWLNNKLTCIFYFYFITHNLLHKQIVVKNMAKIVILTYFAYKNEKIDNENALSC